jgi:hypothetical protein
VNNFVSMNVTMNRYYTSETYSLQGVTPIQVSNQVRRAGWVKRSEGRRGAG